MDTRLLPRGETAVLIIKHGQLFHSARELAFFLGVTEDDAKFRVNAIICDPEDFGGWVVLEGLDAKNPDLIDKAIEKTSDLRLRYYRNEVAGCIRERKRLQAGLDKTVKTMEAYRKKLATTEMNYHESKLYTEEMRRYQ